MQNFSPFDSYFIMTFYYPNNGKCNKKSLNYKKSFTYIGKFFCAKIIKSTPYYLFLERRNNMKRFKIQDLSQFPDCCALSDSGRCIWLAVPVCRGKRCALKRTPKENRESLLYVYHRLSGLDISIQIQIAQKYYQGSMPWTETKTEIAYGLHDHLKSSKEEHCVNGE
jgi:hypothetical protein